MAWSRMAKRSGELTSPASRTDPALVGAASEVRAPIAAAATNQAGWATPDQLASRLDLPNIVKTRHLSLVASVEIAYIVRDTAADQLASPLPRASSGCDLKARLRSRSSRARPAKVSPGPHAANLRPTSWSRCLSQPGAD